MTESSRTSTERCITILLHFVLDHVDLCDILRAMGVNRLWREYAINHPTYYGDLCFSEIPSSLGNPEFFLLRLSRSKGRPIRVYMERTPLDLMHEIGNHLGHITVLIVDVSSADSVGAVLDHLCHPAPVLHTLHLRLGFPTGALTTAPTLPADLLARHAPALDEVSVMGFDLSPGIPDYFSTIKVLTFAGWGQHVPFAFVLPSPFGQCPKLREIGLYNNATLHPDACHSSCYYAWKRMRAVSFTGFDVANRWPAFQLPLQDIPRISVRHGDADSLVALAGTLSGPLQLTFPPLTRHGNPGEEQRILYTADLRSTSRAGDHSRIHEAYLLESEASPISAFSVPALADRFARLELELDAWDNLVGSRTFGPFSALDELVLNLKDDAEFKRRRALPMLSCPKLRRLVLHGTQPNATVDIAALAAFAYASLPLARFPLMLVVDGVQLGGAWKLDDFPSTFSGGVPRGT